MRKLKKPLLFALALLPVAAAGAYFAVRMSLAAADPSVLEAARAQLGSDGLVLAASMLQPVVMALLCGFFGYILAEKLGLLRSFRLERAPTLRTLAVSALCGAVLSLDAWTFVRWIPALGASYESAGCFDAVTWLASILYGGVLEEVMMRLFLMSLLAFLAWKLFFKKEKTVPTVVLIGANILSAAAFAAGHLPATAQTFGTLPPLLVIRCFALNGAFGLVFGRLYRKYGIQYAMLAHALCHVVSRTVWLLAL